MNIIRQCSTVSVLFLLIGGTLFALGRAEEKIEVGTPKVNQVKQELTPVVYYASGDNEVQGYLGIPEGEGPFPAVILIHEWWGYNTSIEAYADAFVREGYVALAIDLYNGEATDDPMRARELATSVRTNLDEAFANLKAAVEYLKNNPEVDGDRIASVGWCFGGGWAYQMAVNNLGTKVSIMYYGTFNLADDFENMRGTILGHFGENDRGILVDDVKQLQVLLQKANEEHAIFIYPNVGHGFARELFTGSSTNEASELAWQRTLSFLDNHLN